MKLVDKALAKKRSQIAAKWKISDFQVYKGLTKENVTPAMQISADSFIISPLMFDSS